MNKKQEETLMILNELAEQIRDKEFSFLKCSIDKDTIKKMIEETEDIIKVEIESVLDGNMKKVYSNAIKRDAEFNKRAFEHEELNNMKEELKQTKLDEITLKGDLSYLKRKFNSYDIVSRLGE